MVAGAITVVQLIPELNSGGVERGTLELGRYLCSQGHRSIVISSGGRLVSSLVQEGSEHIVWPIGEKKPGVLRYILSLRRLMKEEKIDVLHARSRLPAWIGYLAWKSLPKNARPRFVTTFHGYYSVNRYSAIMTKGERVIAISRGIQSHIRKNYGIKSDRIVMIYRGVDNRYFAPENVSESRVEELRGRWNLLNCVHPLIILPARLTPLKGHTLFIESLASIRTMKWDALCVGDTGENPSYCRRLREMIAGCGLEDRVRLVGHCDDMPAALMLADIVVSVSTTHAEAFGRAVVEAQAMGKPVIAAASGGSLETVLDRRTGWLVKPSDATSLSAAMSEALQNEAIRRRYGCCGLKWVHEHFTIDRMCEKTLALYLGLIGEDREYASE